ncbi:class I SAM-dependent methyltransferase [Streptomyces candidus]|uniref:SAM-dependent methyltransferase n=1 Tax=Streptomyces candidus TaxID=67283 RepID=A0A7X0LTS8_9ACTN|nr:class I SAM-dependent methyltransferase [Streptomyces candidus]MBB6439709.1 SAM-dependent methyltransferase [Streptomyces candidus]GHH45818.1 SAM-dependent methyltransferase [Streptomyces candidus]
MTTATDHYDRLLAEHYTWMLGGDLENTAAAQEELLGGLGLAAPPEAEAAAVDLGCGPGPQSLALSRLGYTSITAVDTSKHLLDELVANTRRAGLTEAVHPVHDDIRGILPRLAAPGSLAAVVCMGDTLPHLPDRSDVQNLVADTARALRPAGSFVATYRDLTGELTGPDRFIPVRSTTDRILTCFLDYVDDDTVQVHDLLHTRQDGGWNLTASSYPKLRLAPQWLTDQCTASGLDVRYHAVGPRGLQVLHAVKPS